MRDAVIMQTSAPQDQAITGYGDPEAEAPWAMQLVIQVERLSPPSVTAACEATGIAAVLLLDCAEECGWQAEVDRWVKGRIRKIVRRARGAAWQRVLDLPGVTAEHRGATVRALVPGPTDEVSASIAKLQVEGLVLADPDRRDTLDAVRSDEGIDGGRDGGGEETGAVPVRFVTVAMNPQWPLEEHPGKAAAQVAHAAQLAAAKMTADFYENWRAGGFDVRVVWPNAVKWRDLERDAAVVVTDAGFTVVEPGARTCLARW